MDASRFGDEAEELGRLPLPVSLDLEDVLLAWLGKEDDLVDYFWFGGVVEHLHVAGCHAHHLVGEGVQFECLFCDVVVDRCEDGPCRAFVEVHGREDEAGGDGGVDGQSGQFGRVFLVLVVDGSGDEEESCDDDQPSLQSGSAGAESGEGGCAPQWDLGKFLLSHGLEDIIDILLRELLLPEAGEELG